MICEEFKAKKLILFFVRTLQSPYHRQGVYLKKRNRQVQQSLIKMYYCPMMIPMAFSSHQQMQFGSPANFYQIFPTSNVPQFYNSTLIVPVHNLLPSANSLQGTLMGSTLYAEPKQRNKMIGNQGKRQNNFKQKLSSEEYNPSGANSTTIYHPTNHKMAHPQLLKQEEFEQKCELENQQEGGDENLNINENMANYPKKNTQSNIVNQIFSFVSSEGKSKAIVESYFKKDNKKIISFYQILKAIKKRKKKYINRKYLSTLCTIKQNDVGYKMLLRARNKMNALSVQEFQKLLSLLIMYYLNKQSEVNIITSKKINKITYMEHLERRRQIKIYLLEKFTENRTDKNIDNEE